MLKVQHEPLPAGGAVPRSVPFLCVCERMHAHGLPHQFDPVLGAQDVDHHLQVLR